MDNKTLIEKINNFDYAYEMSDSNVVYEKGLISEKEIKNELKKLSKKEIQQLEDNLSSIGMMCYIRYFKLTI